MQKWKFLTPPGLEFQPLGSLASSQSLYRLRYPGSKIQVRNNRNQHKEEPSKSHGLGFVPFILFHIWVVTLLIVGIPASMSKLSARIADLRVWRFRALRFILGSFNNVFQPHKLHRFEWYDDYKWLIETNKEEIYRRLFEPFIQCILWRDYDREEFQSRWWVRYEVLRRWRFMLYFLDYSTV
jgi:hypothetical protein